MNLTSEAKVLIGIGAATVVILVAAVFFLSQNPTTGPTSSQAENASDPSLLVRDNSHQIATDSAKLTIVEFGDFQCPACKAAEPTVEQALVRYKDKINLVFRHFPLAQHQNAMLAGEASEAANEQGKFWEYHNKLYTNQDEWGELEGAKAEEKLIGYAQELGLNTSQFKQAIDSKKYEQRVKDDLNDGLKLGVNSTPTFYFNNQKYTGNFDPNSFNSKIDQLIK